MATDSEQPLPPSPPAAPPPYTYPPIIIILTIILLILFFVGFFSIYFCRCFVQNLFCMWHLRNTATATPVGGAASSAVVGNGLDPSIVQSFPSFTYSTVKDYRKEKYGLECAICLLEFKGSDLLRLLTTCCHVFHQECIDLWLESHNTCPVCRRNLTSPPLQSPVKSPNHAVAHESQTAPVDHEDQHNHTTSFRITVKDEINEDIRQKGEGVSCDHNIGTDQSDEDARSKLEKYPRSHSTGHSLLRNRANEDEDRFTLRLPQHVKSRIIRGHNASKSWSIFGEYKTKDGPNSAQFTAGASSGDDNV